MAGILLWAEMQAHIMEPFMNAGKLFRLFICGTAVLLALSGCGKKETVETPELLAAGARQGSLNIASLPSLTSAEKKAFSSTAILDKNLSPSMERQVYYHFVKYSRDRRETMEIFLRNSIPYLNYTKSVFRSHALPEDLAYLAYLESGYNPLAVSRSNAVGMWQFIASTGKLYGLPQDWWEDARKDPYRSTEAAAAYLSRLYELFHDWHLAVASYNGGEGKIGRAKEAAGADKLHEIIQKNDTLDYQLQLREETMLYVPRFLAIAKIMRNAEALGIHPSPPDMEHPVLLPSSMVMAPPSTDLVELSRRLGMTWRDFLAYNPHFLRSVSPSGRTSRVYVPKNKEALARQLMKKQISGAGWRYYTVARGETLSSISARTGIPASILRDLNSSKLKKGQRLRFPFSHPSLSSPVPLPSVQEMNLASSSAKPLLPQNDHASHALAELKKSTSSFPQTHTVQKGETLSSIARKYNLSLETLYAANGGSSALRTIKAGQSIHLSSQKLARPIASSEKNTVLQTKIHTVQNGETGYAISRKYGITFPELCAANGGSEDLAKLSPGQKLNIPAKNIPAVSSAKQTSASPQKAAPRSASGTITEYSVQNGETLWSISRKFHMKPTDLLALNGMDMSTRIKVGDTVKVIRNN